MMDFFASTLCLALFAFPFFFFLLARNFFHREVFPSYFIVSALAKLKGDSFRLAAFPSQCGAPGGLAGPPGRPLPDG